EYLDGHLDEALGAGPVGDVVAVDDRLAAGGLDLGHDLLRRRQRAAAAVELGADVVDDHPGALGGEGEGVGPADAPGRPGHDHDSSVTDARHGRNDAQDLTVRQNPGVRYGVTIFPTDRSIGVVELARALEARGLDSLWLPEHTHIPTSRRTPW